MNASAILRTKFLSRLLPAIIAAIVFFSCTQNENRNEEKAATENHAEQNPKRGVWIYLSAKTFKDGDIVNEVRRDLSNSFLSRKLSDQEALLLDSVMKGRLNTDTVPYPAARCFWPKHAVVFYNEKGNPYNRINICFECNRSRSYPEGISSASMSAWRIFFHRIGWPGEGTYEPFIRKAKNDSVF